jgi:large subunit ribosomal protein L3
MGVRSVPRSGSLQFWPRQRAQTALPSVNWGAIKSDKRILGFIGYKVGMSSAFIKDMTPHSLTKDKKMVIPVSIIELPPMRIFSVRFYKNGKVIKEIVAENLDKELKRILKLPKAKHESIDSVTDYDDIRLIVYSRAKETGIKKTPDIIELGLSGSKEEKFAFAKEKINKDIFASEVLKDVKLFDVRGLTKGKGLVGPVKRFGIKLRQHKSEKGVRRPGSLGPWHPAHVIFRVPMQGQLGLFSRIQYNSKVLTLNKITEKNINPKEGFKHYGNIQNEYLILDGSVQGSQKRQLLLTMPLTPSKFQTKKNFEFLGLM